MTGHFLGEGRAPLGKRPGIGRTLVLRPGFRQPTPAPVLPLILGYRFRPRPEPYAKVGARPASPRKIRAKPKTPLAPSRKRLRTERSLPGPAAATSRRRRFRDGLA